MSSLNPEDSTQDSPRPLAGVGPILFAFSVVGAVWIWSTQRDRGLPSHAPSHTAAALPDHAGVDGWAWTLGSLHARLMPLHADPARQRFDGRVLAERLELEPGEPWRLVVTYLPRGGAVEDPVSLRDWTVVDGRGVALRPIVRPAPESTESDLDPLRSLLRVPPTILPGQEVSVVLWGRSPEAASDPDAPRAGDPAIVARTGTGVGDEAPAPLLRLAARRFDAFTAQPSLARLERGGARSAFETPKGPAGPTSHSPVR